MSKLRSGCCRSTAATTLRSKSSAVGFALTWRAALTAAYFEACRLRSRRRFLAERDSAAGVHSCVNDTGERAVPPGVGARSIAHRRLVRLGVRLPEGGDSRGLPLVLAAASFISEVAQDFGFRFYFSERKISAEAFARFGRRVLYPGEERKGGIFNPNLLKILYTRHQSDSVSIAFGSKSFGRRPSNRS